MTTPRMTEKELAEFQCRARISRTKTGWVPEVNGRVGSSTDARRTAATSGSSCEAASQSTKSRRSESASSPPFIPYQLALTGQLPSGKNQVQLLWRNGKVHKYPNTTFTNWRAVAHRQILEQLPVDSGPYLVPTQPNITIPVSLTCEYWPHDARTRDVSGMLDALFHLLVYAKVLKDDGLIYDVTWRRHEMHRKFPKVVLEIQPWLP